MQTANGFASFNFVDIDFSYGIYITGIYIVYFDCETNFKYLVFQADCGNKH